jgi:hypothetical protein
LLRSFLSSFNVRDVRDVRLIAEDLRTSPIS